MKTTIKALLMSMKLKRFLKKEGVLSAFRRNLKKDRDCTLFKHCQDWVKIGKPPRNLIKDAFIWNSTEEGFTFWIGVHEEWIRYDQ